MRDLISPWDAFCFANCQKMACIIPSVAFRFAKDFPYANISYCQRFSCESQQIAYEFARFVPEADIEYCYGFIKFENDKINLVKEFILKDL